MKPIPSGGAIGILLLLEEGQFSLGGSWKIDHTPGQTSHPRVVNQHELDFMGLRVRMRKTEQVNKQETERNREIMREKHRETMRERHRENVNRKTPTHRENTHNMNVW